MAKDHFKETIKSYLDNRAKEDVLFSASYNKKDKNIDDCIKYIYSTVKSLGRNGFTDDEIYSMAVHYYDEDNLEVNKVPLDIEVIVNHVPEIIEEEKKEAKDQTLREIIDEQKLSLKKKKEKPKNNIVEQKSLF